MKVRDARFGQRNAPAALVRSILRAIQQNTSVRCLDLESVRLPADVSTFLDNASSITSFRLSDCDMEPTERQQGARDLAAALQRNTNISSLHLDVLNDIYTIPILEGLRSNVCLKTLIFSLSISDAASHAIHQLLGSKTSMIQRLEWHQVTFSDERLFRPIAQGIINSECVSELKLSWCQFQGQNCIAQLRSILQNKRNLTTLCLCHCRFDGGQVHHDLISVISRPGSLLRCFEIRFYQSIPDIHFGTLLRAIEKSKLERLHLGGILERRQMQNLTQRIPHMKLTELVIGYDGGGVQNVKEELLRAVKNNFSLRAVAAEASRSGTDLFDNDKQTLAFYAIRNESLDQWVDNPETVDRKVWPEAFNLAQRAGPDALFRGLRSVVESDYVKGKGKRRSPPR